MLGRNPYIRGFYCYVQRIGRMRYTICENHLYSKAYAKGKKFVGRRVVVYILPDYAAGRIQRADPNKRRHNRVGITVTKKLGGAVERNRAKRIIREGYAEAMKRPIKQGFLIVIVARSSVLNARSQDLAKDLSAAFDNLGLYARSTDKRSESTASPESGENKEQ